MGAPRCGAGATVPGMSPPPYPGIASRASARAVQPRSSACGAAPDGSAEPGGAASEAAKHLARAGASIREKQKNAGPDSKNLNRTLRSAERALLIPEGLPNRPWYHHAIYAPGVYTGYAAVVIPGVNEAIDAGDLDRTRLQIDALAAAVNRAAVTLESYRQAAAVKPTK